MRQFAEVLLLVASVLLLPLLVNGLQALHPTLKYKPVRRGAMIRGLLVPRQSLCSADFVQCQSTGCCPGDWPCCSDGNCCDPTTYCALGSNGVIGCCQNGEVCSGPAGDPTTITVPSSTQIIISSPTQTIIPSPPTPPSIINPVPIPTSTSSPTLISTTFTPTSITAGSGGLTQNSGSTTTGLSSAAERSQLYRPLVIGGILLAVM